MTQPRKSPYRPGGQYRPTWSFISTGDTFTMGEVLTFVSESRPDGRDVTRYIFEDAAGSPRTFDVPDDMSAMALYQQFRAIDPRDGGCPDCRAQRYRGEAACLEEVGHGAGPTIYYQCRQCMALWEENTREIHVVLDQLLSCSHLQALERDLRASGVRIELETKNWEVSNAGFWVYFRVRIDPVATRAQFELPEFVEYHEWDGRVGGSEAGFNCTRCSSAILGVHPSYSKGHPVFPTNMHVSPRRERHAPHPQSMRRAQRTPSLLRDLAPLIGALLVFFGAIAFGWWAGTK